jgi:CBS domain containing-hemolysin-like protein
VALIVTSIGLVAAFVTSAAEATVAALSPARVRRLDESSVRGSHALARLSEKPSRVGSVHALVSGIAAASIAAVTVWAGGVAVAGASLWAVAIVAGSAAVALVFAVGEALPRAVASANAEGLGLVVAPFASALTSTLYPVARLLSMPSTGMTRLVTGERSPDVPWEDAAEESRSAADEDSRAMGDAAAFYEAVPGLERKVVREVMVPRTDMVAIEDTATIDQALVAITAAGVSRVPVYHETLDDIRGILYAKDLLPRLAASDGATLPIDLARPAFFVPETKPIEELLREMRRRTHIAIVADEYGGTAGLVTIEDLLEEIVGEIFDEYDPQVPMITSLGAGRVRIDARLAVSELDDRFGTDLDVDADTAAGLFTEIAGHIPKAGESVIVQGLRFTVEEMEGNRVRQLVVEPAPRHGDEEDDDE